MVDQVLNICVSAVEAVISWWSTLMSSTGMGKFYVVIMSVVLTLGILLSPILGSLRPGLDAGSDKAAKWITDNRTDRRHTSDGLRKVSRNR